MTLQDLLKPSHVLPLIVLLLTLVNTWLSDDSKVPVTLPPMWRALVVIVSGQLLGVLGAVAEHLPWHALAIHSAVAAVLAISTSHAIWNGDAPAWMQLLAGLVKAIDPAVPTLSTTKKVEEKPEETGDKTSAP